MGCSVRQIDQLSAAEVAEWAEYNRLEPFGSLRDNYHSAQIAHILANVHRGENRPAIPFNRFMHEAQEDRQARVEANMLATMKRWSENG